MTGRTFPNWGWLNQLVDAMPTLDGNDYKVLSAIAIHADDDGFAYPSRATLAEITGINATNVTRSTNRLVKLGYLRLAEPGSKNRKRSNCWQVFPSTGITMTPVTGITTGLTVRHQDPELLLTSDSDLRVSELPSARKRTEAKRDELFEAVAAACRIDWQSPGFTRSERGRLNRAVRELREVGATADEVESRARRYRAKWPNVSCTPSALAGHWSELNGQGTVTGISPEAWKLYLEEHPEHR